MSRAQGRARRAVHACRVHEGAIGVLPAERESDSAAMELEAEIRSQPDLWLRAAASVADAADDLPASGERVAVVGCGIGWFIARSYAALREGSGHGETDGFVASEYPLARRYDRIVAISRTGHTPEIVDLLCAVQGRIPTVLITASADSPAARAASRVIALDFADGAAVAQMSFVTTALAFLRAHLGEDVGAVAADGRRALEMRVTDLLHADQVTFLSHRWTAGLAADAAFTVRHAAQFWSESAPARDFARSSRAIARSGRLVWAIGEPPEDLRDQVFATGARFVTFGLDPLAELVVAQRFAVALARARGLDPGRRRL